MNLIHLVSQDKLTINELIFHRLCVHVHHLAAVCHCYSSGWLPCLLQQRQPFKSKQGQLSLNDKGFVPPRTLTPDTVTAQKTTPLWLKRSEGVSLSVQLPYALAETWLSRRAHCLGMDAVQELQSCPC